MRAEMRGAMRGAMVAQMMGGAAASPYLVLKVRRDNIVQDTMTQVARVKREELKLPLKVQFVGEEGIDEGGVKKEFFLVMVRQLLDPQFAMFTVDPDTRLLWFNGDSLESTMEFELIGVLMGLAIYNSVILDVKVRRGLALCVPASAWLCGLSQDAGPCEFVAPLCSRVLACTVHVHAVVAVRVHLPCPCTVSRSPPYLPSPDTLPLL